MSGEWEGKELLQPIAPDQPCGQSLEDTLLLSSFHSLRLFGQDRPLDRKPDTYDPWKEPEWDAVKESTLDGLKQSKDLRLLAGLGTALLWSNQLPQFLETLKTAAAWLETYWTGVYPLIDEDAVSRRNALNCFVDQMAIIERLRRVPLVASRQHGKFSLRDIDIATGQMPPNANESAADESQIDAAFAEMAIDELNGLQRIVADGRTALQTIEARMRLDGGSESAPGFDPLASQLAKIDRVLRTQLAARGNGDAGALVDGAGSYPTGGAAPVGPIKSRQDAIRALDAVAQFFRQTEPSSPIPLVVERAKRLVSKDFLEVLKEIAPDALAQARAAGGLRDGE